MGSKRDNSSQNNDQNDNEVDLFRASMRGVRPLSAPKRVERPKPAPKPVPRQTQREHARVLQESLIVDDPDPGNDAESWLKAGVQTRILRKLQRGQFRRDAELDLHGLTAAAARAEVQTFLNQAVRFDEQCVRIVHGKGLGSGNRGPVLKRQLGGWLRKRADVLAYCGARAADGGSGATYVLLRRKK
ncbi:MAG TPA: Smr/MutS family protein [Gammaproteobacteria bacterium]|nr:Smr/MutS family protein [Gammaproteobacteria bacterium]